MLPLASEILKNDFHIVDIVSDDGAVEFLTPEQGKKIENAVLMEIMRSNEIAKIRFEESSFDRGRYRYICSSKEVCDWLIGIIPTITPWGNAKVKAINQGAPPTLVKATINVTMPTLEPSDIFTLIGAQNPTIDTSNWKCVHRTKAVNNKQVWTVMVEESSIEALKDVEYAGSRRIKITMQK